jgi:hypothetical protein
VAALARDQHGCRFLQRKFDEGGAAAVTLVFDEVLDQVVDLMVDPFGNYLVQKLLDICHDHQRLRILQVGHGRGRNKPLPRTNPAAVRAQLDSCLFCTHTKLGRWLRGHTSPPDRQCALTQLVSQAVAQRGDQPSVPKTDEGGDEGTREQQQQGEAAEGTRGGTGLPKVSFAG